MLSILAIGSCLHSLLETSGFCILSNWLMKLLSYLCNICIVILGSVGGTIWYVIFHFLIFLLLLLAYGFREKSGLYLMTFLDLKERKVFGNGRFFIVIKDLELFSTCMCFFFYTLSMAFSLMIVFIFLLLIHSLWFVYLFGLALAQLLIEKVTKTL